MATKKKSKDTVRKLTYTPAVPIPGPKLDEVKVEILRCPQHGFYAVAINDSRVTDSKCCGSWSVIRTWRTLKSNIAKLVLP